jgi:hypothetical protein
VLSEFCNPRRRCEIIDVDCSEFVSPVLPGVIIPVEMPRAILALDLIKLVEVVNGKSHRMRNKRQTVDSATASPQSNGEKFSINSSAREHNFFRQWLVRV